MGLYVLRSMCARVTLSFQYFTHMFECNTNTQIPIGTKNCETTVNWKVGHLHIVIGRFLNVSFSLQGECSGVTELSPGSD